MNKNSEHTHTLRLIWILELEKRSTCLQGLEDVSQTKMTLGWGCARPMRSPSHPSRSPARASNSANYRSTNGRERRTEDGGWARARAPPCCEGLSLSFRPLARSSTERALLALYFSLYAAGARTRHSPFSQRERWLYTFMDPFAIPTKLFHLLFFAKQDGSLSRPATEKI